MKIISWKAIEFVTNDTLKLVVIFKDPETISIPVSYFVIIKSSIATRVPRCKFREWELRFLQEQEKPMDHHPR